MLEIKEKMGINEFENFIDTYINLKNERDRKYVCEEMRPLLIYAKAQKASYITYTGHISENEIDGKIIYDDGTIENIEINTATNNYKECITHTISNKKESFIYSSGESTEDLKKRTGYITQNKINDQPIKRYTCKNVAINYINILNRCQNAILEKINKKNKYQDYTLLLTLSGIDTCIVDDDNFINELKKFWYNIENNQFKKLSLIIPSESFSI